MVIVISEHVNMLGVEMRELQVQETVIALGALLQHTDLDGHHVAQHRDKIAAELRVLTNEDGSDVLLNGKPLTLWT